MPTLLAICYSTYGSRHCTKPAWDCVAQAKRPSNNCLLQIKLLVEQGKADVLKTDRWGATPLDEATKLDATRCVAYLKPITEAAMQLQR